MLKINFLKDMTNNESVNAVFTTVNYEKNLMLQALNDDAMAKFDNIIANKKGSYSEAEIEAAKIKRSGLEDANAVLRSENKELEPVYKDTLAAIADASNDYTQNNVTAVRNILRLVACGGNRKFFRIAILSDDTYSLFYEKFELCHSIDDFDENGRRVNFAQAWQAHKDIRVELEKLLKSMFSILVENEHTQKVSVKFNKTDLGMLHECYVRGLELKLVKAEGGDFKFSGYKFKTAITAKKNDDGTMSYDGKVFNELIAKIAFGHLCA